MSISDGRYHIAYAIFQTGERLEVWHLQTWKEALAKINELDKKYEGLM